MTETVLLLHGGGLAPWMWDPVVELLPEFRCVTPSLPDLDSVEAIAEAVASLLTGPATVAGLSLGGQVALALAAAHPERVARAMVSGVITRPVPGAGLASALLPLYMPFRNLRPLVWANLRATGVPPRFLPQFTADTRAITAGSFRRVLRANQAFRVPPGLGASRVPLLILAGEREAREVLASAEDIRRAAPGAAVAVVAGARHGWPLADPARFAAALRAFTRDEALPERLIPAGGAL